MRKPRRRVSDDDEDGVKSEVGDEDKDADGEGDEDDEQGQGGDEDENEDEDEDEEDEEEEVSVRYQLSTLQCSQADMFTVGPTSQTEKARPQTTIHRCGSRG